mmetsp:Transcript_3157/g.7216  ORF Transcript_3157/g.7216 Transcript_3157/m.7216 type:complete len:530 (+) Transcript_3157:198-1787(+)
MMPLHRRHVTGDVTAAAAEPNRRQDRQTDGHDNDDSHSSAEKRAFYGENRSSLPKSTKKKQVLFTWGVVGLQVVTVIFSVYKYRQQHHHHQSEEESSTDRKTTMTVMIASFATSFPAIVSLALGLGLPIVGSKPSDLPHQRYIPLTVAATIVGNQLPAYLSAAMAAIGIWIFGLASRPIVVSETTKSLSSRRQQSSSANKLYGPLKTVLAVLVMIAVLLTENFFVWVVSATYEPSQKLTTLPTPLQDNGQIILRYLFNEVLALTKREVVTLRNMINVEWILVSGLGLSLVAIEMQGTAMRRNLWSMALRGVLTMAAARSIRTVSFLITVLPSQNPRCYFSHFPSPPPAEWIPWLMVGFTPQVNGGCNDLIISGHATVTSTLACVVTSIVSKPVFTAALWTFVAMDYMVEVYEGFHYSVDMWLGAVLVNFIWTVLAPLEESSSSSSAPEELVAAKKFYPLHESTVSDMVWYFLPAFVAYIQLVFIPQDLGNYTIVAYVAAVVYQLSRFGFQQYTQHVLFCLLFMALGLYL